MYAYLVLISWETRWERNFHLYCNANTPLSVVSTLTGPPYTLWFSESKSYFTIEINCSLDSPLVMRLQVITLWSISSLELELDILIQYKLSFHIMSCVYPHLSMWGKLGSKRIQKHGRYTILEIIFPGFLDHCYKSLLSLHMEKSPWLVSQCPSLFRHCLAVITAVNFKAPVHS